MGVHDTYPRESEVLSGSLFQWNYTLYKLINDGRATIPAASLSTVPAFDNVRVMDGKIEARENLKIVVLVHHRRQETSHIPWP